MRPRQLAHVYSRPRGMQSYNRRRRCHARVCVCACLPAGKPDLHGNLGVQLPVSAKAVWASRLFLDAGRVARASVCLSASTTYSYLYLFICQPCPWKSWLTSCPFRYSFPSTGPCWPRLSPFPLSRHSKSAARSPHDVSLLLSNPLARRDNAFCLSTANTASAAAAAMPSLDPSELNTVIAVLGMPVCPICRSSEAPC